MKKRVLIIGLEPDEVEFLKSQLEFSYVLMFYEVIPKVLLKEGKLYVESQKVNGKFLRVDKVIFYGIFENDFDFINLLTFWKGACFPNPLAMLNLRQRIPALARSLAVSEFNGMSRGMVINQQEYSTQNEMVAKWGIWHCGEDKAKFSGAWKSTETSVIENFIEGNAVRIMKIGNQYWQIQLEGESWLKSLHGEGAHVMKMDTDLYRDAKRITNHFQMEIAGIDYIVTDSEKHLLEVNHIPSITAFEDMRIAFLNYVVKWINNEK